MKIQPGDLFTVNIADGVVLMEARSIRCGDVWDCHPVDSGGEYSDEYGSHMVFTDEQLARKVAFYKGRYAS